MYLRESNEQLLQAYNQMRRYAEDLGAAVTDLRRSRQELEEAYLDTIHRLSLAVEYKDEDTGAHVVRLSRCSGLLARRLGYDGAFASRLAYAAPLHDVGKIGIPDAILLKPDRLTEEEFAVMQTHAVIGAKLLTNSRSDTLECGRVVALSHHERWNGRGYPFGLSGEAIPIEGRIVGIVDVFDALLSTRPYKQAYPADVARKIIAKEVGEHFDPQVGKVFLEHWDDFLAIKKEVDGQGALLQDFTCNTWDLACANALQEE